MAEKPEWPVRRQLMPRRDLRAKTPRAQESQRPRYENDTKSDQDAGDDALAGEPRWHVVRANRAGNPEVQHHERNGMNRQHCEREPRGVLAFGNRRPGLRKRQLREAYENAREAEGGPERKVRAIEKNVGVGHRTSRVPGYSRGPRFMIPGQQVTLFRATPAPASAQAVRDRRRTSPPRCALPPSAGTRAPRCG